MGFRKSIYFLLINSFLNANELVFQFKKYSFQGVGKQSDKISGVVAWIDSVYIDINIDTVYSKNAKEYIGYTKIEKIINKLGSSGETRIDTSKFLRLLDSNGAYFYNSINQIQRDEFITNYFNENSKVDTLFSDSIVRGLNVIYFKENANPERWFGKGIGLLYLRNYFATISWWVTYELKLINLDNYNGNVLKLKNRVGNPNEKPNLKIKNSMLKFNILGRIFKK